MPYLQLDVNGHYSVAEKELLAAKMSETYAKMMSVDIRRISVGIRELEILGLREDRLNVEFTQHSGDEMYHPALGGYSPEWEPGQQ